MKTILFTLLLLVVGSSADLFAGYNESYVIQPRRELRGNKGWKCLRPFVNGDCTGTGASGLCSDVDTYSKKHEYLVNAGNVIVLNGCDSVGSCLTSLLRVMDIAIQLDVGVLFMQHIPGVDIMLEPNVIDYSQNGNYVLPKSSSKIAVFDGGYIAMTSKYQDFNKKKIAGMEPNRVVKISDISDKISKLRSKTPKQIADTMACSFRYLFRRTAYAEELMKKMYKKMSTEAGAGTIGSSAGFNMVIWQVKRDKADKELGGGSVEKEAALFSGYMETHKVFPEAASASHIIVAGNQQTLNEGMVREGVQSKAISKKGKPYGWYTVPSEHGHGKEVSDASVGGGGGSAYELAGVRQLVEMFLALDSGLLIYNSVSHLTLLTTYILNMQCKKISPLSQQSSAVSLTSCVREGYGKMGVYGLPADQQDDTSYGLHMPDLPSLLAKVSMKKPCGEPLWCDESAIIQQRIEKHQQRTPQECAKANYLIFNPVNFGIGSMLHMMASALSVAICTNRILYLANTGVIEVWKPRNCQSDTSPECYFQRVTNCQLSAKEIGPISKLPRLDYKSWTSLKNTRIVMAEGSIPDGPCSFCSPQPKFPFIADLSERDAFLGHEAPIMANLIRYVLRPLPWFDKAVHDFILRQKVQYIPRPFASVHVRYGDKIIKEAKKMPLSHYMDIIKQHRTDIKDVFLSTETDSVIHELRKNYKDFNFHIFEYSRIEKKHPSKFPPGAGELEFIASFANLGMFI